MILLLTGDSVGASLHFQVVLCWLQLWFVTLWECHVLSCISQALIIVCCLQIPCTFVVMLCCLVLPMSSCNVICMLIIVICIVSKSCFLCILL
jgi:hypothetical protein